MSCSWVAAPTPTCTCAGIRQNAISWRNFFLFWDRLTHWAERVHIRPLRKMALKKAERWMLERFEMSDGLGAIYPAMLNAIIALRCLGYSNDDPQVIRAMDEFEKLGIDEPTRHRRITPEPTFRMQPCVFAGLGYCADGVRRWARRGSPAPMRAC